MKNTMDRKKVIDSVITILKNLEYDNDTILIKQLASAFDLIDCVGIDIQGTESACSHPEDSLLNLSTMGDEEQTFQCMKCNEKITIPWEGDE